MIKSVEYFERLKKDRKVIRTFDKESDYCSLFYIHEILVDSKGNLEGFILINTDWESPDNLEYLETKWLKDITDIIISDVDQDEEENTN